MNRDAFMRLALHLDRLPADQFRMIDVDRDITAHVVAMQGISPELAPDAIAATMTMLGIHEQAALAICNPAVLFDASAAWQHRRPAEWAPHDAATFLRTVGNGSLVLRPRERHVPWHWAPPGANDGPDLGAEIAWLRRVFGTVLTDGMEAQETADLIRQVIRVRLTLARKVGQEHQAHGVWHPLLSPIDGYVGTLISYLLALLGGDASVTPSEWRAYLTEAREQAEAAGALDAFGPVLAPDAAQRGNL